MIKSQLYNNKHVAFTLAEVLVTIAVVGVVASMTVPNLFKFYTKAVYYNQFKKEYSDLYQASTMILAEKGDILSVYTELNEDYDAAIRDAFAENLK